MSVFQIEITDKAEKDIKRLRKHGNLNALKKIEHLLEELALHPYDGTGKPEPLKYSLSGLWSRRIDLKNRLIYEVLESDLKVVIISLSGHYKDN